MSGNKSANKAKKDEKIKQKPSVIIKNNFEMLRRVARYIPGYPVFMVLDGLIWGGLNSIGTLFTFRLFNLLDSTGVTFRDVLINILVMVGSYTLGYLFDAWYWEFFNTTLFQKLEYCMQREMHEKARTYDLSCYDDPKFYNDYVFAMEQARDKAWGVTESIGKLINRLIGSATILTVLSTINPWIALILLVNTAGTIIINGYFNKLSYRQNLEQNPVNRRSSYINRVFHLADYAKELRSGDLAGRLERMYDESVEQSIAIAVKYGKKRFPVGLVWEGKGLIVQGGVMLICISLLSEGRILLGGFAAAVSAIWNLDWLLRDLVQRVQKFPEQSLYIEKYLTFMAYEPKIKGGDRIPGDFESLELKNVSFTYPFGDAGEVLSDVSMTLKKGEKIAVVGYNGAGKTTLTKLIMRLYDVSAGEILYNGVNIKEFDLEAYRGKISSVFQDFKIFASTLAENVVADVFEPSMKKRVESALAKLDFSPDPDKFQRGLDTMLTREFDDDGVNLSGGEAQKVAISRVLAAGAGLMIMDEPSAALDPIAEYDLNHSILNRGVHDGNSVIFISHRLSTTRMADRIYMFANGRLTEQGSHEQLMKLGGAYAGMFNMQASKYRTE